MQDCSSQASSVSQIGRDPSEESKVKPALLQRVEACLEKSSFTKSCVLLLCRIGNSQNNE